MVTCNELEENGEGVVRHFEGRSGWSKEYLFQGNVNSATCIGYGQSSSVLEYRGTCISVPGKSQLSLSLSNQEKFTLLMTARGWLFVAEQKSIPGENTWKLFYLFQKSEPSYNTK
jgi:hypothetical protein